MQCTLLPVNQSLRIVLCCLSSVHGPLIRIYLAPRIAPTILLVHVHVCKLWQTFQKQFERFQYCQSNYPNTMFNQCWWYIVDLEAARLTFSLSQNITIPVPQSECSDDWWYKLSHNQRGSKMAGKHTRQCRSPSKHHLRHIEIKNVCVKHFVVLFKLCIVIRV